MLPSFCAQENTPLPTVSEHTPRSMNQLPSRRDDRMISPTSLSFILDDAAHRLR
jgi:hypothetical protein